MPESAEAWRQQHHVLWLFDPWTGVQRERLEIERDKYGRLIVPPGEEPPFKKWMPGFVKTHGAFTMFGQLEKAGWSVEFDGSSPSLLTKVSRGMLALTFELMEPLDEERFYLLAHDETLRRSMLFIE